MKRVLIFLAITFALSWIYEFVVVYPLVESDVSQGISATATFAIGAVMFSPAIGVGLNRLVTPEGLKKIVLTHYTWHGSVPQSSWLLVPWFTSLYSQAILIRKMPSSQPCWSGKWLILAYRRICQAS